MPFDGDTQEYFDAFMAGHLPLYTESGKKLNPYDYIGKTGRRLIRFQAASQEAYAERLIGAVKQPAPTKPSRRLSDRIARIELELSELKKSLCGACQSQPRDGFPTRHNQYRGTRTPRQDDKVVAGFPPYEIQEGEGAQ